MRDLDINVNELWNESSSFGLSTGIHGKHLRLIFCVFANSPIGTVLNLLNARIDV